MKGVVVEVGWAWLLRMLSMMDPRGLSAEATAGFDVGDSDGGGSAGGGGSTCVSMCGVAVISPIRFASEEVRGG